MDSLWFLAGCGGFFWLVMWSLRDFSRPSRSFWPFDARWMRGGETGDGTPRPWRRRTAGPAQRPRP